MEQNTENTEVNETQPKLTKEQIDEFMELMARKKKKGCRSNSPARAITARRTKNKNARSERRRQRRAA